MRKENISVCMATYNGEKYIEEQINSILMQLIAGDELIIIDDKSKDNTLKIISEFNDDKIRAFKNEKNIGVNKNFEKAIEMARNDYIFMADQDDIWMENRVEIMMGELRKNEIFLVSGNQSFIDGSGEKSNYRVEDLKSFESRNKWRNIYKIFIGKGSYFGCAMAFKKQLKKIILPFPNYIESHDLWIAKVAILSKSSFHLDEKVLYRRIHGNNASVVDRRLIKKIESRLIFLKSIFEIIKRKNKIK